MDTIDYGCVLGHMASYFADVPNIVLFHVSFLDFICALRAAYVYRQSTTHQVHWTRSLLTVIATYFSA